MFELHPTLFADTHAAGHLPLCEMLVMKDENYPWFVLVPRRPNLREAYELSPEDQQQLTCEVNCFAQFVQGKVGAEKMNVAALGNMVPQLHIHVIARSSTDPAWPAPVWGKLPAKPLSESGLAQRLALAREFLIHFSAEFGAEVTD